MSTLYRHLNSVVFYFQTLTCVYLFSISTRFYCFSPSALLTIILTSLNSVIAITLYNIAY